MNIEQVCRDMLEIAIKEGLVSNSDGFYDPDPQKRTSGELVAVANRLSDALNEPDEKPCCKVVEGRVCGQPSSVMWVIGGEYVYACNEHAHHLTNDLYVGDVCEQ